MPLAYYSTPQSYQIPQIESVVTSVVISSRLALEQLLGSESMRRISCCQHFGPLQNLALFTWISFITTNKKIIMQWRITLHLLQLLHPT